MSSTTGCRYCEGLCAGAVSRCHHCGTWVRKQDYYSTIEGATEAESSATGEHRALSGSPG